MEGEKGGEKKRRMGGREGTGVQPAQPPPAAPAGSSSPPPPPLPAPLPLSLTPHSHSHASAPPTHILLPTPHTLTLVACFALLSRLSTPPHPMLAPCSLHTPCPRS
eukprot:2211047-Rhodomonas_salina.1